MPSVTGASARVVALEIAAGEGIANDLAINIVARSPVAATVHDPSLERRPETVVMIVLVFLCGYLAASREEPC